MDLDVAKIIVGEVRRLTTEMTKIPTALNSSVAIGSVTPGGLRFMEELTQHNQSRRTISDQIQEKFIIDL